MNNEIKSLDNGDFEVIYPQGKDKAFYERVVAIGLGVWFASVAVAGVVGVIVRLG